MADDDWNYLVNLWSNKDWKMKFKRLTTEVAEGSLQMSGDEMFVEGSSSSTICDLQMQLKESEEKRKENDANLLRQLKEYEERGKENNANLLRKLKEFEEHRKESETNGSSSSTICDLQMQLKESEEKRKENDANLLRQLKEYEERGKENNANLLRKLKEFEEHRKESETNVQLLKAQVNQVESWLAQVVLDAPNGIISTMKLGANWVDMHLLKWMYVLYEKGKYWRDGVFSTRKYMKKGCIIFFSMILAFVMGMAFLLGSGTSP
nr:hypothetical protein CFP56_47688 [Quercus suber]